MKLSKSVRSVIIAAAVLLVLGAVLMILMLTSPKESGDTSSFSIDLGEEEQAIPLVEKKADDILSFSVSNEHGKFTFDRQSRVVSTADESGNVTSSDEYYWTSGGLGEVLQNDAAVRSFAESLAALNAVSVVEEDAAEQEKYGLETPLASVGISFADGTKTDLYFGIQNPANTSLAYCRSSAGGTVYLVNYYAVLKAYSDVKDFADLVMTEEYNTDGSNELDYLKVERKDLDEPVELRYMFELAQASQDENTVVSTFNTHRFVKPITAEIDVTKGKELCYAAYGLTMSGCEFLEQTEENMKACGLDDPFAKVAFKYGGKEYVLLLGNEITENVGGGEGASALTSVKGYYAALEGVPGIYSLAKESAPWYGFSITDVISKRPLSPYIYSVESVTITVPEGEFRFDIDSGNKTFSCGGKAVDGDEFRSFYQQLISAIGEELYTVQTDGEPYASVRFRYKSDYAAIYGTEEDVLEFFECDDRKAVINLNGRTIFKVREIYVTRLVENVNALMNGEKVNLDW